MASNSSPETATTAKPVALRDRLRSLVPALLGLAFVINILSPIFAWQWIQLPFPGFFVEPGLVVGLPYGPSWAAQTDIETPTRAIRNPDMLLSIDELRVANNAAWQTALAQHRPGDEVTLTFRNLNAQQTENGQVSIVEQTRQLIRFPLVDGFVFFLLPYAAGLSFLAMSFFVYRHQQSNRAAQVLVVFGTLFSIFSATLFDLYSTHRFVWLWTSLLPFLGATLIHISLVLPNEAKLLRRAAWVRLIPYAIALVLSGYGLFSILSSDTNLSHFVAWQLVFVFNTASVFIFLLSTFYNWYVSFAARTRQQITVLFIGAALAFLPFSFWTLLSVITGQNLPLISWVYSLTFGATVFFPVAVGYAIWRLDFLGLQDILQASTRAFRLNGLTVLVYGSGVVLLHLFITRQNPLENPVAVLMYALGLGLLFAPLRTFLARQFLTETPSPGHDYQQVLQDYPSALLTVPLNVDSILEQYLSQVEVNLTVHSLSVFLLNEKTTSYELRAERQTQAPQKNVQISYLITDGLPQWLRQHRAPLCLTNGNPLGTDTNIQPEELARLAMLSIQVVVPLFGTTMLLGWVSLGARGNEQPYTEEDLRFLNTLANQTAIALENARLLEVSSQKTEQLLALQQTSMDIASAQGTERTLSALLERTTQLLHAHGGTIYLFKEKQGVLRPEVCYNMAAEYADLQFNLGEGIPGRVAQSAAPYLVSHYHSIVDQVARYDDPEFGAVMAVPLAWQGKLQGVLELIRHRNGLPFNNDDLNLTRILASQASVTLENARLLAEATNRASQLSTLNDVNRIISATLDREEALNQVLEMSVEILGTEAGSVFMVDQSSQNLIFEIALGPTGVTLIGARIPIDETSIAGSIALNRQGMVVNNVATNPRWNTSFDESSDFQTRDILGVPMVAFERVVGVIEVINKLDGQGFTEDDLSLLHIFADQAAIAIVNAQRFTQTDQALAGRVQELNTLQMIDRELNTELAVSSVLHLTLSRTMDAMGASVGLIAMVDAEQQGLLFKASVGIAKRYDRYQQSPWSLQQGIIGQVARTGHPLRVGGADMDIFASDGRSVYQLCVPILLNEDVMGIISLETADPDPYTEKDVEFTMRLASHASLAIRNAQLFEAVQAANQAKTEFMSVASHELKIPMTSIKGYARMMEMVGATSLSEQQREFLQIITSNVDRMSRLVSDLLDVSRIEAGRIQLEMGQVYINEVVEEVLQSVQTQLQEKQLQVEVAVPNTLPPVWADHGRLVQVMTNLISNAYKYTPEAGKIEIRAKVVNGHGDKQLSVAVADTGYGISDEDQQQLFRKFFRATDQNIRDVPGTGLGLAITRSMIEMHGGEIWFNSTLGEGSTFGFDLPLEADTHSA